MECAIPYFYQFESLRVMAWKTDVHLKINNLQLVSKGKLKFLIIDIHICILRNGKCN